MINRITVLDSEYVNRVYIVVWRGKRSAMYHTRLDRAQGMINRMIESHRLAIDYVDMSNDRITSYMIFNVLY